jgi:hypothetical protein
MKKRRFIRGFFIALLTLCVAAWVASYLQGLRIEYVGNGWYTALIGGGRFGLLLTLGNGTPATGPGVRPGWEIVANLDYRNYWLMWDGTADVHGLGFAYFHHKALWRISMPLWFPTLLSAALLVLVWRKTRPQYNGKGFPIEPTANANDSTAR